MVPCAPDEAMGLDVEFSMCAKCATRGLMMFKGSLMCSTTGSERYVRGGFTGFAVLSSNVSIEIGARGSTISMFSWVGGVVVFV